MFELYSDGSGKPIDVLDLQFVLISNVINYQE